MTGTRAPHPTRPWFGCALCAALTACAPDKPSDAGSAEPTIDVCDDRDLDDDGVDDLSSNEILPLMGADLSGGVARVVDFAGRVWEDWDCAGGGDYFPMMTAAREGTWWALSDDSVARWEDGVWSVVPFDREYEHVLDIALAPDGSPWVLGGSVPCGDSCPMNEVHLAHLVGDAWVVENISLEGYSNDLDLWFDHLVALDDRRLVIYGDEGLVATWDGSAWADVPGSLFSSPFTSSVASGDAILAGTRDGEFIAAPSTS